LWCKRQYYNPPCQKQVFEQLDQSYKEKASLDDAVVLMTAAKACSNTFLEIFSRIQQSIIDQSSKEDHLHFFIHFGVFAGSKAFRLEKFGYNEADFRCPDESGYKPNHSKIVDNLPLGTRQNSSFVDDDTFDKIFSTLKNSFACKESSDPGRFVCNYIYYTSLKTCEKQSSCFKSLFVHVPQFSEINQEKQQAFAKALLQAIIDVYLGKE